MERIKIPKYVLNGMLLITLSSSCRSVSKIRSKYNGEAVTRPSRIANDRSLSREEKVEKLKSLVENEPSFYMASDWYISTVGVEDSIALEKQYAIWMKRFPSVIELPMVLGRALADENNPKAKFYFNEALKINPKYTPAWKALSLLAYSENDETARTDYLLQGIKANPRDAELAYRYALQSDKEKCSRLLNQLVNKFPKSEYAAISLSYLIWHTNNAVEKLKLFEKAKKFYLSQTEKFDVATNLMTSY